MIELAVSEFGKKLKSGPVFGTFMKSCDPAFAEAAGYAGMDFIILDMEHGPVSLEHMQNNIRAAQIAGCIPIVRVSALNETLISQALDIGAAGVQIPQIANAGDAEAAVRAAKYHPSGERGVCRFVRSAKYSSTPKDIYFEQANASTLVIIQLEGKSAFDELDEILKVPGVDIIFIGPYDLSQSLGVPGQVTHPKVVECMSDIVARAGKFGAVTGIFTDTPEMMKMWIDAGVRYISYSVDVGIFYNACAGLTKEFRACLTAPDDSN